MAIRKLDRSFAPTTKQLNYLAQTFPQWRQSFINFAKAYYPDTHTDFNEASPGMMFIEMASAMGDVLSFYINNQFKESLIQYAEEQSSIIAMAQSMGYKPKPTGAAWTLVDLYQLCPALGAADSFVPDTRFMLHLSADTVVSSTAFGTVNFRTTTDVNFADALDREVSVYAVNAQNQPLTYLIKKKARVVAGDIKTYEVSFGTAEKFTTVRIPDTNVLEVISVRDSSGFTWYEVDYLAQDLILDARENVAPTTATNQGIPPTHLLRVRRTPRRFVTRYNDQFQMEMVFGSGLLDDTDTTINLQANKIASDEYQLNLASTSLDPSDFLSSRSYGLAPANLTMTISYVTGGGLVSNVPSNSITKVTTVSVANDRTVFSASEQALFNDIIASLAVNNPSPATGGKDSESVEEIRQNAMAFFNAQNRVVNAQDYTVRAYAMPVKYGSIAKAFVAPDKQINDIIRSTIDAASTGTFVDDLAGQNVINLYTLGYDQNKALTTLNDDVKQNLRTYIDQYRILTDEIRILDAFVVNIGVTFNVVVFKGFNMNEVLARCISVLQDFFDIDKWQINQPIVLADLYTELAIIDGVQSVTSVKVVNKYQFRDGADYNDYIYDIDAATFDGIVYPSLDPCIFEIRYPNNDIVGTAQQ
jgi:hypothetical protein